MTIAEAPHTCKWKTVKLEDIATTGTGGTPSRKETTYFDGGIPWVKSGELEDNFIYETKETISVSYTHLTLPTILLL